MRQAVYTEWSLQMMTLDSSAEQNSVKRQQWSYFGDGDRMPIIRVIGQYSVSRPVIAGSG
jgi:hypothetical protein